ncbi:hypothetical protein ACIQWB_35225 [Streptomyces olivaceus]|uniref:hypothetical protein n=1 Tax=Streptomyces olivaceus TaxID=47716 RepID=UPI0038204D14
MNEQGVTEARAQLTDARRAKEEADALIEALEERVRSGDEEVVVMELGQQHGVRRLAELQRERAERRVKAAEVAERRQTLNEARQAATDELGAVSDTVLAVKYAAALSTLVDFTVACQSRETVVRRHADRLRDLGDTQLRVDTGDSRRIIDTAGQRFESERCTPQQMLLRVAGAVAAALELRAPAGRSSDTVRRPEYLHPVERLLAEEAGMDAAALEVHWASTQFAARVVEQARVTVGEVA